MSRGYWPPSWRNGECSAGVEVRPPADPSATPALVIFNQKELLDRLLGDQGVARQVIAGFLNHVPWQFSPMKKRLDAGDAQGARLLAHTLKGAAATVSAEVLRAIALAMERAAAAGECDHCGELLPRAIEEFERLKSTLERTGWA